MSRTELEVTVSDDGKGEVVIIDGPIDSETFEHLKEKLDPLCNKPGSKVILDCQRLTYINSRGIGLLVKYHRNAMSSRGRLVLFGLNAKLVRTLDLLQLGKALFIFQTREEAMAAI